MLLLSFKMDLGEVRLFHIYNILIIYTNYLDFKSINMKSDAQSKFMKYGDYITLLGTTSNIKHGNT
jgi:hypothetical protein